MKRSTWLLLLTWAITLGSLVFLFRNPFGIPFWSVLYVFLAESALGCLFAARSLVLKKKWLIKATGAFPLLLALIFGTLFLILATDYRWFLPGFPGQGPSPKAWQSDFAFLKKELAQHPIFEDSLNPSLLDQEFSTNENQDLALTRFMRLAGSFPDGHTMIHPFQPSVRAKYFPLQGYWFHDGYHVVRAANQYKHLIGMKVLSINDVSIAMLLARIDSITGPENKWQSLHQFDQFIFSANVLHGLGILPGVGECKIGVADSTGLVTNHIVQSEPFFTYMFWLLKPIDPNDLTPAKANLRKPNYSLQYDSVNQWILFPFHMIQSESKRSIRQLARDLDETILNHDVKIIIDLRNNLGGDNQAYGPLLEVIEKHKLTRQFYLLISRKTFSAGVNFISDIKRVSAITLVGEPSGAGPNHYGDPRHLWLPETKISVFISTRSWVYDSLHRSRWYVPDIPVDYYYQQFRNGYDPWLEAVRADD